MRCSRGIDIAAKSCVYCNWWQADAPPPRAEAVPVVESAPAAAPEHRWSRKALGAIAFAALLILAFVIGSLVHGFEPSDVKAAQQPKTASAATPAVPATTEPRANVPLVPDNAPPGAAPFTPATAPPTGSMNGAMGEDPTATTSQQYGAGQGATAQPAQPQSVDPRSLTGAAYQQGQPVAPAPAPRPQRKSSPSRVAQTQPVPEYQPVPSLRGHGHARLALTVGTDGRVKDIDILNPIEGEMGRLVGAVQSWRFRPATDNGVPVTSRFTVDINVE